ncbi:MULTISPECIES: RHS repeat-associated core domain-containing protein [Pseudomonas]|uniref:RHS repeat-associated core domain-containing protein n=1 Tax=Pseudomonas plecoglossicida TaxID=70775 RepID=A0ABX4U3S9_PSEDL|nr:MULTISPECIES: RHS repeat-associated core domain-containing protein [Pseudomonas]MBA6112006.1 RHS repeat-associated core domain-containing protein [Pseudomonas asiatica]PLU88471.1 hypothetical protein CXG44_05385 [Pseudomonas plecoglossicida]PLU93730.1 hypothetical protein CXG45_09060 [Pseudomonas plecoglossicida]PLV04483.1 hypothetical protein CXG48_08920 [Pseudomonas plecoglossicida]PLV13971.1 hypothetical protein CXG47_14305 [Pseudomonas plecoglossicida]
MHTPLLGIREYLPSKRTLQGFNGEFIDILLGVYHLGLGYRAYSPDLMRFQSPDSLSPFGKGGTNCYAYCGGDPINYTDPTGHALVHGQRVSKNSAVALPHKFKPSTLKRTTSHASALKPSAPRYSTAPEPTDHFMRIGEPDIFKSIIRNLPFEDAVAFANTSSTINSFAAPIIDRYLTKIFESNATIGAARAGILPGVPGTFAQSLNLPRPEHLNDIGRIQNLGGPVNFLRLIRHGQRETRTHARIARRGSIDDLMANDY